jgi:cysteine-rich repeat protein
MLTGGENCDDGNAMSGDGCTSTCLTEPGWSCTGTTCTQAQCGNELPETGENCDLGAQNGLFYGDGTGCSKTCTQEPNCRPDGTTQACSTACGDGNIDDLDGETCDDGNAVDGDGCSSACVLEAGFTCQTVVNTDTQPCSSGAGECLLVPIIYRDFDGEHEATGHPDFFYLGGARTCVPNASGRQDPNLFSDNGGPCWATDSTDLCQGLVTDYRW